MEENKIQLLQCPRGGLNCKPHLAEINRLFVDSQNYKQNKEYQFSIQALKNAFDETFELQASTCIHCANVFREEIIDSLKIKQDELYRMSRGIFRRKDRYVNSLKLVDKTLSDLTTKLQQIKDNKDNPSRQFGT
jgi:hypothetical protein